MSSADAYDEEDKPFLIDDSPSSEQTRADSISPRQKWTIILITAVLASIVSTALTVTLTRLLLGIRSEAEMLSQDSTLATTHQALDCGSSVDSALSRGCKFDIMSFSWVPPACYDEELIDTFLHQHDWRWYREPVSTTHSSSAVSVPLEEVRLGEHDALWVTREFHLYHCAFQWRKMHRCVLQNRLMDGYIANFSHTEHCGHVLVSPVLHEELQTVDVMIKRKFPTCGGEDEKAIY